MSIVSSTGGGVETETWTQRNQRLLIAELDRVHAQTTGATWARTAELEETRIAQVETVFRLSPFERDLLLWSAGMELDSRFTTPTFGAAMAVLKEGHWDAMAPAAPLRHWRLVELIPGHGLVDRPLRIDERVLHHLTGVTCVDSRLDGLVKPLPMAAGRLTAAQAAVAAEVAVFAAGRAGQMVTLLDGADGPTRERVAAHVAAALGLLLLVVPGDRIPPPGPDNALLARLVEREVALLGALPLVACDDPDRAVAAFVAELGCVVLVGGVSRLPGVRGAIARTVPSPGVTEQRELWWQTLNGQSKSETVVAQVAASFRFEVTDIEAVVANLGAQSLHHACRLHARGSLSDLADRIEPRAGWADLVVPDLAAETLRDITSQVRNRTKVYEEWGMAASSGRGLGVTALFTGESGTGKTLAAEVLAAELDLDLYRIDLAAVVSKYIGETEKNLKRVFDAADTSGAVLLFDEADAIFGKRSEVHDSHDRYANLEISYLLQRMETYRGLAVLTTNLRSALDKSFLRRIRFVVSFPFPDQDARARIWRLMFPATVPTSNVDFDRLARLQLPGGHIRTIALGAAFLAADASEPVGMAHVLAAARREYAKLEKPLTETEIGGWE